MSNSPSTNSFKFHHKKYFLLFSLGLLVLTVINIGFISSKLCSWPIDISKSFAAHSEKGNYSTFSKYEVFNAITLVLSASSLSVSLLFPILVPIFKYICNNIVLSIISIIFTIISWLIFLEAYCVLLLLAISAILCIATVCFDESVRYVALFLKFNIDSSAIITSNYPSVMTIFFIFTILRAQAIASIIMMMEISFQYLSDVRVIICCLLIFSNIFLVFSLDSFFKNTLHVLLTSIILLKKERRENHVIKTSFLITFYSLGSISRGTLHNLFLLHGSPMYLVPKVNNGIIPIEDVRFKETDKYNMTDFMAKYFPSVFANKYRGWLSSYTMLTAKPCPPNIIQYHELSGNFHDLFPKLFGIFHRCIYSVEFWFASFIVLLASFVVIAIAKYYIMSNNSPTMLCICSAITSMTISGEVATLLVPAVMSKIFEDIKPQNLPEEKDDDVNS